MEHNQNTDQQHMDHSPSNKTVEYIKFAGIMSVILILSLLISSNSDLTFLDSFMGVFFIVFAGFKISRLKEFAYGIQSYDLIAKNSLAYSYSYPFIQLAFGFLYLGGLGSVYVDSLVVIISLISGAGVINSLKKKQHVHCVCLGNVIKLPLSTISFVEDFGMALMAFAMIFIR